MTTPIEELELSVRAYTILRRAGIHTVEQLKDIKLEVELPRLRNMGRMTFNEIVTSVGREDLAF